METVNNVAASAQSAAASAYTTASNLIFGESKNAESGKEPLSGEQGEGTATEPFDQGNKYDGAAASETSERTALEGVAQPEKSGEEPLSGVQGQGTLNEPFDKGNEKDGAAASQSTQAASSTPSSGAAGLIGGGLPTATSTTHVAESSTPIQNDRDANKMVDVPSGGQQDEVKTSNEDGREAMSKGVPIAGPGGSASGNDLSGEAIKAQADEKYKSTGVAAEGGNFDATKPGAGAEASRLLEKKEKETGADADAETGDGDAKTKPKLSERIKEKLHIHKH